MNETDIIERWEYNFYADDGAFILPLKNLEYFMMKLTLTMDTGDMHIGFNKSGIMSIGTFTPKEKSEFLDPNATLQFPIVE